MDPYLAEPYKHESSPCDYGGTIESYYLSDIFPGGGLHHYAAGWEKDGRCILIAYGKTRQEAIATLLQRITQSQGDLK